MSRWIVALLSIAVAISLGHGRTASAATAADSVAGGVTSAQRQEPAPASKRPSKSAAATARHRHHFAQQAKPPTREPPPGVVAKMPPAFPPPLTVADDETVLKPRSVYTISVPGPAATPPEAPTQIAEPDAFRAEAGADANTSRRPDVDNAPTNLLLLAEKYLSNRSDRPDRSDRSDRYDDTALSAVARTASPLPLTAVELLMLFGACGGAAIGFYALVALNGQRRTRRAGTTPPLRRSQARPPSSSRDRYPDRVETQRLFPHQFGAAIRGR
jgi:hypothetical protein